MTDKGDKLETLADSRNLALVLTFDDILTEITPEAVRFRRPYDAITQDKGEVLMEFSRDTFDDVMSAVDVFPQR